MGFKTRFIIVLVAVGILALGVLTGCGGAGSPVPENRAPDTTSGETNEEVVLQVAGITCSSCADIIEVAVSRVDGVKDVVMDNTGKLTIVFEPQKTNVEALREAVRQAGYDVQ